MSFLKILSSALLLGWSMLFGQDPPMPEGKTSIYDFSLKNIDGEEVSLADYRGKTLLIVNVASRCGYTPQYEGLQKLYEMYSDSGLLVLGFPANNFLNQEPGNNQDIKQFCSTTYGVTFPLFAKISVTGPNIHPLYAFLTSQKTNPVFGEKITWNFNKFLVDKTGRIVDRFSSKDTPLGERVLSAIRKHL